MKIDPVDTLPLSIIADFRPALEVEQVLRGQGIDPDRARPDIVAVAADVIDRAHELLAPAAMYTIVPVHDFHHQTVVLDGAASLPSALDGAASLPSALDGAAPEGGAAFEGPLVARALAGATQVALAVTTIGPALEEQVDDLFKVDPVRALALDGAGVAAIGAVSKMVVDRIRAEASARGLGSGMRASPGQEGWSIWQQRALFSVVPAGQIGVCLADTCLMLPRKSNSFVVGLGPEMQPGAVTCDFCSKRGRCPWRVR